MSDPYLIALPSHPVLKINSNLKIETGSYYERPVEPVVVIDYQGTNGVDGARGADGRPGSRQPGESGAPGQHGTPADSGRFIDANIVGLSSDLEGGVGITILGTRTDIPLPKSTNVTDPVSIISVRGGNGGNGGDGGDGGNGTDGHGNGGWGGGGGAAGHGGFCRLTTTNPYLLMLTRVDIRPGVAGRGGKCGCGPSGVDGPNGPVGEYGGVEYAILSPDGSVLEESVTPYHLEIVSYDIIDDMKDSIVEPGEGFTITNVTVMNAGGLTLPAGCKFQFCNTSTVCFEPHDAILGSLPPGGSFILPDIFRGRVNDLPEPDFEGPLVSSATFPTSSNLLNRQFQQGSIWTNITVENPVVISKITYPQQMARGDLTELRVSVSNVSSITYGVDPLTELVVRIVTTPKFTPGLPIIGLNEHGSPMVDFVISNLQPGQEQTVSLPVTMNLNGPELFDTLPWRAELLLRKKKIQFDTGRIRVSPKWSEYADVNADVAIFTGHHWNRTEYLLWERLMNDLGLHAKIWDFDYYNGISFNSKTMRRHDDKTGESWTQGWLESVGQGGSISSSTTSIRNDMLLIFNVSTIEQLSTLVIEDVYKHFMTFPNLTELTFNTPVVDEHGVLLFGINANALRNQILYAGMELDLGKQFKDSYTFTSPDEKDAKSKAKSILNKLNNTEFFHKISHLKINPTNTSGRTWQFGELRIKRLAFRKHARLFGIDNTLLATLGSQFPPHHTLDLNTNYGLMFFRILAAMPYRVRFRVLSSAPACVNKYKIIRKVNEPYSSTECTMMDFMTLMFYTEVRTDFILEDKNRPRLEALTVFVENNAEALKTQHQNLVLILYVYKRAQKRAKFGDKSATKMKDRIKAVLWGKNYKKDQDYINYDKHADKLISSHEKEVSITTFLLQAIPSIIYDMSDK